MPESSETQDYAALAPSQALGSQTTNKNSKTNNNNNRKHPPSSKSNPEAVNPREIADQPATRRRRNRNRRKGSGNRGGDAITVATSETPSGRNDGNTTGDPSSSAPPPARPPSKPGNLDRGRKNLKKNEQGAEASETLAPTATPQPTQAKNKKTKNRKRYPWRRFVPVGCVDPITLESLQSLEYPPFALMANAPYDPVPVWPVPENQQGIDSESQKPPTIDIEELNRKRIAEQWGTKFTGDEDKKDSTEQATAPPMDASKRHYNLYDGRALAYYIVSQLQFIDPLNRRDLTRPELLNLDVYLRRHGFQDLNVTDAYDAKGVTISSAGAAATTAQGRADIMQQIARNLLNSLFGGPSVSVPLRPAETSLQEQYAALQLQEQQQQQQPRQRGRNGGHQQQMGSSMLNPDAVPFDTGFYASEDGGLMVIDDDENIGMRGGNYGASRGNNFVGRASSVNPFYSASHITAMHGSGLVSGSSVEAFPELPTPAASVNQVAGSAAPTTKGVQATNGQVPKPSKTLSRIAGAVKKLTPEEQHKQWKAREEARKRAMMATLSSGVDASVQSQGLLKPPPGLSTSSSSAGDVSEEKLQRNKAFADALGVKPATLRQSANSGWVRPTAAQITLDEFGNELNVVIYPDSLLSQARDRMSLVLKVEKKWKAFLEDDKSASLPLHPMDRPTRIFVHHYSDFWNLKTESFDPEPQRYIHCVKLPETHMPRPLLSDAARKWRGPTAVVPMVSLADLPRGPAASTADSQQTAGEPSKSREIPSPPERVPLPLQPRTLAPGEQKDDNDKPLSTQFDEQEGNPSGGSRFALLLEERERPKIALAKRTVPLELPPFQPRTTEFNSEAEIQQRRARLAESERRKKEAEERKRRAMEDVFASDDENDDEEHDGKAGDAASAGSDWEEPEAVYQGSDGEE